MRSGNGRHRRPRQAPAVVVAAGVTGAGIALPLLGATSAHAADATAWDRAADCASGGVWSAKGTNGHYGGLQLDLDTWKYYGGTIYADRPDLASRSQQIAVAEKILEAEGAPAFAHCGSGLETDGTPDVDPGAEPGNGPADSSDSSDSSDSGTGGDHARSDADEQDQKPSHEGEQGDGADKKGGSGDRSSSPSPRPSDGETTQPGASDSASPSDRPTGSDRSDRSDPDGRDDTGPSSPEATAPSGDHSSSAPSTPSGDDASGWSDQGPSSPERLKSPSAGDGRADTPGQGRHRGQQAEEGRGSRGGDGGEKDRASRDADRDRTDGGRGRHRITVRPGDSLSKLAAERDVPGGWSGLYERNRDVVGDDPDLIRPGQHLRV